jgi:hypothetical protein
MMSALRAKTDIDLRRQDLCFLTRLGHRSRPRATKDLKLDRLAATQRQAVARVCLAASKAASRSANLPLAAPARATMVGAGNLSKK